MEFDQEQQEQKNVPPYVSSNSVGFHKEYPKQLYKQVFEPEVSMKPNYKAIKIFDPQELVRHLQKNFPLIRKNVQQFDDQMKNLSLTFGNLIIRGFHIDDFLKKFFLVLDKRVHKFFDHLDQKVLKWDRDKGQEIIPGDYKTGDNRQYVRQKLIEMSNDIVAKFGSKRTPLEYDKEVIKKIEQILRVYELLKYDQGWNIMINITRFNLEELLELICTNDLQSISTIDALIDQLLVISMKQIKEATFKEQTTPLYLNKDVVLAKFHQIINDRSDPQMNTEDLYYVTKTVCLRDRRIIYNEFYNEINKELKEIAPEYFQFANTQKSDYQKEREELHKSLLKIQNDWEALKLDENYYLVLEDRINEEDLRKVPLTSEQQLLQLQRLNNFAIKASNLQYYAVGLLGKIINHKNDSKTQVEQKLQEALDKAKQFYQQQTPGRKPQSNQIKQHIDILYNELAVILNSDPSKYQTQATALEKSLESQIQKNKQNPYLQNIQKELHRQQLASDQLYKNQENENKKRSELVNAQIDLMIQQSNQRELYHEDQSTRPYSNINYQGKIMEGSSIVNEAYYEKVGKDYPRPVHEEGKWEKEILKQQQEKAKSLNRDVYVGQKPGYYIDDIIGPPKDPNQLREQQYRPPSQPVKQQPTSQPQKPKEQPKQPEPPKKQPEQPKQQQAKQPEPPKKQEPPKEQPKKQEPPKEQPKKPEPPKQPDPPKKQEPPKQPDPPKKQEPPKQPEPQKKPEPPKEQPKKPEPPKEPPKQPDPPKKPEPPKEPPKKPEPPKEPPKQPDPPKKPDPPKEPPKQPEPPKKPEPPKEPPKKPEPPKEPPKQPDPPKKPEPPKEPPKQPDPPKKPEPPKEPPKQPEPPKKPEPPKQPDPPKQPEPPKKPEPPKQPEPPKKPEPPKQPDPPKQPEPPKKPEPPKQPDPPKQPEPQKKPEPPKQPEPKKPEPPKEQPKPEPPKQPDPPKKPEPQKQPEPPKKEVPKQPGPQKKVDPYAIDFNDDDDEFGVDVDDDEEFGMEYNPTRKEPPKNQPQQKEDPKKQQQKYGMIGLDSEEDDVGGGQKEIDKLMQGEDEEGAGIEQLQLITPETLPQINKYVKGTKYGKSTKIQIEEFNSYESMIQLFEEFLIQDEAYFLDFEETAMIFQIYEKVISEEDPNQDIEEFMKLIQMKFMERTQKPNFGEQKMYFPIDDNPFEFFMIEKDHIQKVLVLYYEKQPTEQAMGQEFEEFMGIFQQLFQCEDFEISQMILNPQTQKKLAPYGEEEKYLKYMLVLFTMIYEQMSPPDIIISDDTIARAFWILHQTTEFYTLLQESEEEVRNSFQEILIEGQKKEPSIGLAQIEEQYSPEGIENLEQQVQMTYAEFLENKQLKQFFLSVDVVFVQQQQKLTFYIHLSRVAQLNFVKIFTLQNYGQMGEQILQMFITDEALFTQKVYQDYSRHNMFQEYSEVTLGAWYHLVTKKNLKSEEAMSNLVFSLIPFNLILTNQE